MNKEKYSNECYICWDSNEKNKNAKNNYINEMEFIGSCYIDKCNVTKSHKHKLCNYCLMFLKEKYSNIKKLK